MGNKPFTLTFGKFKIYVEDPDNPNQWIAPCGFTDKALNFTGTTSEEDIPDCDDPDAPAWVGRNIKSLSASVNGSGVMAMESLSLWRRLFFAAQAFRVRVALDVPAANGGGYYQGGVVMTQFNHTGTLGERAKVANTMDSDSEWTWTPAG